MKIIAALMVGCLFSMHAFAAGEPSPDRVRSATELLHILHAEKASAMGASVMINAMIQSNPMMEPYRGVMMKWAQKYLSWRRMGPKIARLYANAFSEAQLRDLIRFYKTPTGQKAIRELPELTRQAAMVGEQVARKHIGELSRMIKARAAQLNKVSP